MAVVDEADVQFPDRLADLGGGQAADLEFASPDISPPISREILQTAVAIARMDEELCYPRPQGAEHVHQEVRRDLVKPTSEIAHRGHDVVRTPQALAFNGCAIASAEGEDKPLLEITGAPPVT